MAEKKCPDCPPKGAPAFMTTYGDLMTLLLTFFVLLLSMSDSNEAKFKVAMGSLQGALGILPHEQSVFVPMEVPIPQLTNLQESEIQETLQEMQDKSEDLDISDMVKMEITEQGIHITLSDSFLFNPGQARLKQDILPILISIADLARGWPNKMLIMGHTDSDEINTLQFRSNWELSTARSLEVLHFMANQGNLEERDLIPMGLSEYYPLDSNDTPTGKAKNRRVEIIIQYVRENASVPANVKSFIEKFNRIK